MTRRAGLAIATGVLLLGCPPATTPPDAGAGAVPWAHVTVTGRGGYDFPLLTLWDGAGWSPVGTTPDGRTEEAIAPSYDCAAWEITTHGRRLAPGGSAADPYTREDLESFLAWWSGLAGAEVHLYNRWASVVADGSLAAVQLVAPLYTGTPTAGSATPACDGPSHDQGQGLFAVALPPGFDARRAAKYPVVFVSPGSTTSLLDLFLVPEAWRAVEGPAAELAPRLLGESVRVGGAGVIVLFGSAGGQGAQGTGPEYAKAVDEILRRLERDANADLTRVVTTGISRGGSNALLHASRPGRAYRVVGAFANVPATRYSPLATLPLNLMPVHGTYVRQTCGVDPDCANAWRWDHQPTPGAPPYELLRPFFGTADADEADARAPWGTRAGFDADAWVELCTGERDHAAGAGLAEEYVAALPATVRKRLNVVYGSAHRGNFFACDEHLRELVLGELAGNASWAGRFASAQQGTFASRLSLTDWSATAGSRATDFTALQPSACGTPPPVLVVPYWQEYREATLQAEPSGFLLTGELQRRWRVDLTEGVSSAAPVLTWEGGGGRPLPAGCAPFPVPTSTQTVLCRYQGGIERCTGGASLGCGPGHATCRAMCGWRLHFDCNGDGVEEAVDPQHTPFRDWLLVGNVAQAGAQGQSGNRGSRNFG